MRPPGPWIPKACAGQKGYGETPFSNCYRIGHSETGHTHALYLRISYSLVGIDDSLVREIVNRVLSVTKPDRIILFGSAAAGKMTRDSDIDLLVVSPAPANTIEERVQLHRSLRGLGLPVEVFIIGAEKFEESKNIFGGIAYPAHKYGRVIYEAA